MNETINIVKAGKGWTLEWSNGEKIPGVFKSRHGAVRCAIEFLEIYEFAFLRNQTQAKEFDRLQLSGYSDDERLAES